MATIQKNKSLRSGVSCINENLDPSKANCDWYVHPDFPTLLLVVANRYIADDEQLYLSYGPDYWCQDRFPIHILKAAVKGYAIDIDKSAAWRRLKCYKELKRALDTNDSEDIKAPSKSRTAEQQMPMHHLLTARKELDLNPRLITPPPTRTPYSSNVNSL